MSVNTEKISPDALSKAFELLDEATSLIKSKVEVPLVASPVIQKSDSGDDDMEKAKGTASFLIKAGMSKEDACNTMVKGGISLTVAQGAAESVIAAANAKKEGGDTAVLSKAQIDELGKKVEGDIKKSIEPVALEIGGVKDAIQKGFDSFKTIMKSMQEQNEALVESNKGLSERLAKVESTPGQKKSITTAGAIEKFQKGEEGNRLEGMEYINVNSKEDLKKLVNLIDAANDVIKKGGTADGDPLLEKAIESIEMAYEVPQAAYARLRAMNIILQKG